MRAARIVSSGKIEVVNEEIPQVEDSKVLVKLLKTVICGSDLPYFYENYDPDSYPLPSGCPGHECLGIVEESRCDEYEKGDFQLMSLRWVGLSDPDVFHYIFHSSSMPPNGANRGRYESAEVDRWIDASRVEADDAERARLYRNIQEKISDDCVYASLWWPDNVVVLREGFEGFEPLPGGHYTSLARVRRSAGDSVGGGDGK